jgi:hypothetical protein
MTDDLLLATDRSVITDKYEPNDENKNAGQNIFTRVTCHASVRRASSMAHSKAFKLVRHAQYYRR